MFSESGRRFRLLNYSEEMKVAEATGEELEEIPTTISEASLRMALPISTLR